MSALAVSAADEEKLRGLRRMKLVAVGALIAAAVIYAVAFVLERDGVGWAGYVRAAAEAGMVGALADWFAHTMPSWSPSPPTRTATRRDPRAACKRHRHQQASDQVSGGRVGCHSQSRPAIHPQMGQDLHHDLPDRHTRGVRIGRGGTSASASGLQAGLRRVDVSRAARRALGPAQLLRSAIRSCVRGGRLADGHPNPSPPRWQSHEGEVQSSRRSTPYDTCSARGCCGSAKRAPRTSPRQRATQALRPPSACGRMTFRGRCSGWVTLTG